MFFGRKPTDLTSARIEAATVAWRPLGWEANYEEP